MKKILVTRKLLDSNEEKLKKLYDVKLNSNDELYSQKKLIEMSQGCDGILSALTDKLDKETINLLPESVKILSNFAVGFGNIDLEAAKKRNITVTNTPEVLTDATAEIGILLILGACRRASEGIEGARAGDWKWSADYLIGKQLTGSRLGILGMGRIGQKIAKIAKSLGMIIHYHNRSKLNSEKEQGAIYHEKLESLLSVSDVLSVCCPASKETINLINKIDNLARVREHPGRTVLYDVFGEIEEWQNKFFKFSEADRYLEEYSMAYKLIVTNYVYRSKHETLLILKELSNSNKSNEKE